MLAPRTGLEGVEAARDRVFDRVVVADVEVEKRALLDRAPVATEEPISAADVERARDRTTRVARDHDLDRFGHPRDHELEEFSIQVLLRPRVEALDRREIESLHRVEHFFRDRGAAVGRRHDAALEDEPPLALQLVAPLRVEGREKIVVRRVALIFPVKLDADARREAGGEERVLVAGAREEDVRARHVDLGHHLSKRLREERRERIARRVVADEDSRAGRGREGDRGDELRVVRDAEPLGVARPLMIEDELALAVSLHVERHRGDDLAALADDERAREPADLRRDAPRLLERREPRPPHERAVSRRQQPVPRVLRNRAHAVHHLDRDLALLHRRSSTLPPPDGGWYTA